MRRPDGVLQRYAELVVRRPWLVMGFLAVVSAVVIAPVRNLRWEMRFADIVPQEHVNAQIAKRIRELFGSERTALVTIRARQGDLFTPETLRRVTELTRLVEKIPGVVPSSVLSLASSRVTRVRTDGDALVVEPVMAQIPQDDAGLRRLRTELVDDPLYRNLIVSADGATASIVADFTDTASTAAVYAQLADAAGRFRDERTDVVLTGQLVLLWQLEVYSQRAIWVFPVTLLIVALIHYEAFRTVQAMALPLITAMLSLALALGIMCWLGYTLDPWSATTPVIILAIAAGHAVQMLKRYYEELARSGDTRRAVVDSLVAVGPVMLTAGGIAAAGFASLATFGVRSVRVFGLFLASGVVSALLVEMTLIPACRVLLPAPRERERQRERAPSLVKRLAQMIGRLVVRSPRGVLITAVIGILAVGAGAFRIPVNNSYRDWFYAGSQPRLDDDFVNQQLGGTTTLHLLVEGTHPGSLEEPAVVAAVADLERLVAQRPEIGKVISYVDFLMPLHRTLAADGTPGRNGMPDSRELIAQYLLLYSAGAGADGLSALLDADHRWALVVAFSRSDEAQFGRSLMADINALVEHRFAGLPARVHVGAGLLGLGLAMNDTVVGEKLRNVAQVSLIIAILSAVALRSTIGGLFVLAPLTVAVLMNLGLMGWTSISLSMVTATITAMGVSVGADFAIYLLYRIREERARGAGLREAVGESLATAGEAICFVSSAIVGGYLTLLLAGFRTWTQVASLSALMITASALATLMLIPALLLVLRPRFIDP